MSTDVMRFFGIAAVSALLAINGFAAESKSEFAKAQEMIKAKDPKGFEEVQKLAASDMNAAMTKLRQLAAQYRVNLPSSRFSNAGSNRENRGFSRNGGRGGRGGFGQGGRGGRGGRGGFGQSGQSGQGGRGGFGQGGMARNGGRGGFNRGGMGGMNAFAKIIAEYEIELKFPKETAEFSKKMQEIEQKYAELAGKAGVTWNEGIENKLRKLRTMDAEGFAASVAAYKENTRSGMMKFFELAKKHNVELMPRRTGERGNAPGLSGANSSGGRRIARPNFGKLRTQYPEEMKKYESLRRSDPEAARKLLEELVRKSASK